jgi:hypothetical protein
MSWSLLGRDAFRLRIWSSQDLWAQLRLDSPAAKRILKTLSTLDAPGGDGPRFTVTVMPLTISHPFVCVPEAPSKPAAREIRVVS